MSDHPRLDLAIEQARLAREAGNHPFGAVLADDRPIVFKTSGMSWEDLVVAKAVYEEVS